MNAGNRPTAYDVAGRYDDAYFDDLAGRYLHRSRFARRRVANVLSLLPPLSGARVLDLGCGMGTFTIEAARQGAVAVGVDLAPAALPVALRVAAAELDRQRTALEVAEPQAGPVDDAGRARQGGAARFVRADAARLPFAGRVLDLVLAADFTEHLDEATLRLVLAEAARVLRPGGRLVVYTPSPTHFLERLRDRGILRDQDPSHIGMRTLKQLAAVVEAAGFEVLRTSYLPSHLPGLEWLERAFGRWVPWLRRRIGIVAMLREARERAA